MGGKINNEIYVNHDGKRVYFCCKGCISRFNKNPAKYVKKLEADGEALKQPSDKDNINKANCGSEKTDNQQKRKSTCGCS